MKCFSRKISKFNVIWTIACLSSLCGLVMYIFYLKELHIKIRQLSQLQKEKILTEIHDIVTEALHSEDKNKMHQSLSEIKTVLKKQLNTELLNPDNERLSCGRNIPEDEKVVCDEVYEGAMGAQKNFVRSTWHLNLEKCKNPNPDWSKLVTVILSPKLCLSLNEVKDKFGAFYPGVRIVQACLDGRKVGTLENIRTFEVSAKPSGWNALVNSVKTPYVLVGRDLNSLAESSLLERSLRLLQDSSIGVVSGATRNLTGHWKADCFQAEISNYQLDLKPGYQTSHCDCMKCDIIESSPFLTKTDLLRENLLHDLESVEVMFINFFLRLQNRGYDTLFCPDIMYETFTTKLSNFQSIPRKDWIPLAQAFSFQAISLDHSPRISESFSCDQVGLKCDPRNQQSQALLLPWCCLSSFALVLANLERLSNKLGFHYELDAGTALGAVKLGHFIPWDIDADIFIPTEDVKHFETGGEAKKELESLGISVYGFSNDNYADKGARYFKLWLDGIEVEMLGRRGYLSLPDRTSTPTRVFMSGVWARAHYNPGSYARSRYGPGYLKHAQSWRYVHLEDSFQQYNKNGARWNLCEDPSFHGCLEKYPADGNVLFHQDNFKEWSKYKQ